MIMSLKEEMLKIRAERTALSQKIRAMAGEVFASEAKTLFDNYPVLASFSWTQYTPYFNDGETCEFGAHTDYVTVTDIDGNEQEDVSAWSVRYYGEKGTDWQGKPYTPSELDLAAASACDFLAEFEPEDYLMMFGDHTKVTVHRDGQVDTDDYNHE
jgi:hypothetical protein